MNERQFEAEMNYQAAIEIAEGFRKNGLLTEEEYHQIDTILLQKYRPLLGGLSSDITCNPAPSE
ncbi:SHOCT domain-containing protein [Enterocloster clostridioformis]|uniref:SHOCT domain-containing protein n=1 Tax=Enterocloster clostridioformis TaxID=1531 RepID=UPI0034A3FF9C